MFMISVNCTVEDACVHILADTGILSNSLTMVQVTSESQLATLDRHSKELFNKTWKRDPVVYSNPFDPVL